MAAISFDPLEYAHDLEASGVSRKQAEVHAKAMTARFLHNFESLPRFTELELRLESKLDKRLAVLESSLGEQFSNVDARFAQMGERFAQMDVRFERMEGKFSLVFWMLGLTIVCAVVPEILKLLS